MAKILIVDDESEIRQMLKLMLEKEGYEVSEASNGNEAIEMFNEDPSDLVITDLIMPEKEGLGTIREIRKNNPDVKIIAISGGHRFGLKSYLDASKTFGADMTFQKPLVLKDIREAIKDLLSIE